MHCQVCGASEEPEIDWEGKLDAVVYKLSQISETLKQIECNTDRQILNITNKPVQKGD